MDEDLNGLQGTSMLSNKNSFAVSLEIEMEVPFLNISPVFNLNPHPPHQYIQHFFSYFNILQTITP